MNNYDQWKDPSFLEKLARIKAEIALASASPMQIGSTVQGIVDRGKIEKGIFYEVKSLSPFVVAEVGTMDAFRCLPEEFKHYHFPV